MIESPPLRRNRSFQLLWVGSAASDLGSTVTSLALPLLILAVTESPALAGVAATCQLVARMLLGLPAGVWVDRLDRRRILITCEAIRLAAFGFFAAVVFQDAIAFWHIIVVSLLHGGASAFFRPAHAAAIQGVVPKSQLPSAYAQEEARSYAATLAGPPLGGLLFTLGRALPFLVDAVTYFVSLVCILAARVPRRPVAAPGSQPGARQAMTGPTKEGIRSDVAEALRWLWQQRGLSAAIALAVVSNILAAAVLLPIIVLVGERGGGAITAGGVLTGLGVGGLVGAIAASRVSRLLPPGKLMIAVHLLVALAFCAMTLPLGPWWPVVPLALAWVAVPAVNVVLMALIGQLVPSEMMGRMHSLVEVGTMGLAPAGPLIGGFLAAAWGGAGALLTIGVALLVTGTVATTSRSLRQLQGATEQEPGQPESLPRLPTLAGDREVGDRPSP